MTRRGDDRGFVTAWTVALVAACWGLVGLSVDGGRALRGRSEAFGAAASGARAGAQMLDERAAVEGVVRLDEAAARQAAIDYVIEQGFNSPSVDVAGLDVNVTITDSVDLAILPGSVQYTVSATARVLPGSGP